MPVFASYRNQSIDMHSKSIDWFLYESNTGIFMLDLFTKVNLEVTCNRTTLFVALQLTHAQFHASPKI